MIGKTNVGGENVKAEVEYQTPLITQILEGLVGKAQGANATADKILEGYSAYVGQKLVEGTAKEGIPIPSGFTKFAVDKITFSSNTETARLQHSLGVTPKVSILFSPPREKALSIYLGITTKNYVTDVPGGGSTLNLNGSNSTDNYPLSVLYHNYGIADETQVGFYSKVIYQAGVEYTLITMA